MAKLFSVSIGNSFDDSTTCKIVIVPNSYTLADAKIYSSTLVLEDFNGEYISGVQQINADYFAYTEDDFNEIKDILK